MRRVYTGVFLLSLVAGSCSRSEPFLPVSPVLKSGSNGTRASFEARLGDASLNLRSFPKKQVTVADPVYHATKRYEGVSLLELLNKIVSPGDTRHFEVVFLCSDGYRASVPLDPAVVRYGVVAMRDLDAPPGVNWIPLSSTSPGKTPEPFYLVWEEEGRPELPWPYGITEIEVWMSDPLADAEPADKTSAVSKGYTIFRSHCVSCHSVNGTGGSVGPELNTPANVTEYWNKEALTLFILNPSSVRHRSRMPVLTGLNGEDASAVIAYLEQMKHRKIQLP